ncbi:MAG: sensor domain-containing diguanylate cyclase [Deltaproteobacteria bacterium]|nr:sensor domain-containing diguanylate cyclase [Deltaproteobacteria bacterium]MCL5277603.1 sensor domain-containing diguanylate cyclase [Deltaproteobacteria bacterium]
MRNDQKASIDYNELKQTSSGNKGIDILHEIGKTLTSTLDLKEVLSIIMQKISELLRTSNWSLLLIDEERHELFFEIAVGENSDKLKNMRLAIGEGIAGWVAMTGEALLIPDVNKDPRFTTKMDDVTNFKTQSVICVPLRSKGRVLGVVELINKLEDTQFSADDLHILTILTDYAAIAIENAKYLQRVQELTIKDDLTSLYNSRYLYLMLESEMGRSKRYGLHFSMIFLDLDHFKLVNDRYGHLIGSEVLKETAEVIRMELRKPDVPIRYGGDEFVVLLPETDKKGAYKVASRMRELLNNHTFLRQEGLGIKLTASFGVSSYPEDADNTLDLVRLSDQAMYRIKETTRDGIAMAG